MIGDLDDAIERPLAPHRLPRLVSLARNVTVFGNAATLWIVAPVASGFLWAARCRRDAAHLAVAAGAGAALVTAIKLAVGRARPAIVPHLVEVHSLSFPSGHAASSTFVYGTLALIAARHAGGGRQRIYIGAALPLLLVAIGCSRVMLGDAPADRRARGMGARRRVGARGRSLARHRQAYPAAARPRIARRVAHGDNPPPGRCGVDRRIDPRQGAHRIAPSSPR